MKLQTWLDLWCHTDSHYSLNFQMKGNSDRFLFYKVHHSTLSLKSQRSKKGYRRWDYDSGQCMNVCNFRQEAKNRWTNAQFNQLCWGEELERLSGSTAHKFTSNLRFQRTTKKSSTSKCLLSSLCKLVKKVSYLEKLVFSLSTFAFLSSASINHDEKNCKF